MVIEMFSFQMLSYPLRGDCGFANRRLRSMASFYCGWLAWGLLIGPLWLLFDSRRIGVVEFVRLFLSFPKTK